MFKNNYDLESTMKVIREKNLGYTAIDEKGGKCFYRQEVNGQTNCCLVGAFIPDSEYNPRMENESADYVIRDYSLEKYMPFHESVMEELQRFHDNEISDDVKGEEFYKMVENKIIDLISE